MDTRLPGETDLAATIKGLNDLARAQYLPQGTRSERVTFHPVCEASEWEAIKQTVHHEASRAEGVNFNLADQGNITFWGSRSLAWLEEQGVRFTRTSSLDAPLKEQGRY